MFTTPAIDLAGLARRLGESGKFNRWQSRVGGLPEFNGEFPVAALADELQTPGRGQIRAFVTIAGNPVLSNPNGRRLDTALQQMFIADGTPVRCEVAMKMKKVRSVVSRFDSLPTADTADTAVEKNPRPYNPLW